MKTLIVIMKILDYFKRITKQMKKSNSFQKMQTYKKIIKKIFVKGNKVTKNKMI